MSLLFILLSSTAWPPWTGAKFHLVALITCTSTWKAQRMQKQLVGDAGVPKVWMPVRNLVVTRRARMCAERKFLAGNPCEGSCASAIFAIFPLNLLRSCCRDFCCHAETGFASSIYLLLLSLLLYLVIILLDQSNLYMKWQLLGAFFFTPCSFARKGYIWRTIILGSDFWFFWLQNKSKGKSMKSGKENPGETQAPKEPTRQNKMTPHMRDGETPAPKRK